MSAPIEDAERSPGTTLSGPRRTLFGVIVALLAVSPLIVCEGLLRFSDVRIADDPFLNFGQVDSYFVHKDIDGRPHYQVANREVYRERHTAFPVKKTPQTFRVFCLGGSASAGWPHPQEEIYTRYLQRALEAAYPHRTIEVLNVSAHAYAAYRVRLIFQEVIEFEPDLMVIYSGNNEFLEKRVYGEEPTWWEPVSGALNRLHLVRRVKGSSLGRRLWPENTLLADERQHVAYEQWSKIEQLALELRRNPRQYQQVKNHYAFSIQSMVETAGDRKVPVILVSIPVNLRQWHPNVSDQALEGPTRRMWEGLYRSGEGLLLHGDAQGAARRLREAAGLAPFHADTHFALGRALERSGDYEAALQSYSRARDLDYNPFRAPSDLNQILRQIAARYDHVSLADAERAFLAASAPLAPGFDLFLDYVHPTRRGNVLVANTVYDEIVARGLLGPPSVGSTAVFSLGSQAIGGSAPYDEQRDYPMQGVLVRLFVMMHQYESAVEKARFLQNEPGALETLRRKEDGKLVDAVLNVFPEVIKRERELALGAEADPQLSRQLEARLKTFYRENFGGYDEFRTTAAPSPDKTLPAT